MGSGEQVQAGGVTGFRMTPEFMAAVAEGVVAALAKQPAAAVAPTADAVQPTAAAASLPTRIGEVADEVLASPLPVSGWRKPLHRLASRKLWVTVGTVSGLLAQNTLGLNLPPATQVAVAAVSAIYVAAQAVVDSAKTGGGNG